MANDKIKYESMLRVGTLLRKIYRIDRYLSSGGFGNTYVATNVEFDEVVAIKEFFIKGVSQRDSNKTTVSVSNSENTDLFDKQLQKFKKEARRIRKLKNDHIVQVYDLFEENGTAYYVMDYIDGESLSERMERIHSPLSEEEVLKYYPQILDALKTVHDKGIFHLDLKPGNIMVDAQGNVKLIDFGASKQQDNEKGAKDSNSTLMCFTNGYAPREQIDRRFEKIGPWTDIYALGATLYALLTHQQPPMPSDIDDDRSADKHLALPLPENVSEETRDLILKMMKTNRLDRPQSVDELLIEDAVDFDDGGGTLIDFSKEFEGWQDKVAGKYYYQGYYNSMEKIIERLKGAKSMEEGVRLKAE
ncbi:MAG: serine/threonine protein kinase, partial [Prevotella sp.]|nr:serine/threonine protein kinase [Prevotella sp.]